MQRTSPTQCRKFVVRGKVQGVFFRASTRDEARNLGITGHAINLPDGSVEILACGGAEALQELRAWLRCGPAMARVDGLDEEAVESAAPSSFTTA